MPKRVMVIILMIAALAPASRSAEHVPTVHRHVLVLHSYHPGYPWTQRLNESLHDYLVSDRDIIDLHVEYLDSKRFDVDYVFPFMQQLVASKYRTIRPDLVLVSDNNALDFVLHYRDSLFRGIPVVFCGINNFVPEMLGGDPLITGVRENIDLGGTIELVLRLQPEVGTIAVVTDVVPTGKLHRQEFLRIAPFFADRVEFVDLHELGPDTLLEQLRELPENAAVLNLSFQRDPSGEDYSPRESVELIDQAGFPQYSCWEQYLGHGIIGGMIMDARVQGRQAAEIALEILTGRPVSDIPVQDSINVPMFDYRELIHFELPVEVLPEDSILVNEPETFWHLYQREILIVFYAFLVMTGLIIYLVHTIFRRRRVEKTLKTLFGSIPDIVLVFTGQGRILHANPAAAARLGYELEVLLGKTIFDIEGREFSRSLRRRLENGRAFRSANFQGHYVTHAGTSFDVDVKYAQIDYEGRPAYLSVARDITEIKRTEDLLRQERNFSTTVLDTVGSLVIVLDTQGRIVMFNRACEELSGYTLDEVAGRVFWDFLLPPDEIERVREGFQYLAEGNTGHFENHWLTKDGRLRLIEWSNAAIRSPEGRVMYVMGTGVDVTEQRRAQEDLRRSEERFRSLVEQAPDEIILHDIDGRILDVNRTAVEYLGYTRDELLNLRVNDIEAEWDAIDVLRPLWQKVIDQGRQTVTGTHKRKDGSTFPVEVSISSLPGTEPPLLIGTVRDISERIKSQQAIADQLEFEKLVSEISRTFVNIPYDQVDREIDTTLCRLAMYFCTQRASFMEPVNEHQVRISHFFELIPTDIASQFDMIEIPWFNHRIRQGEVIRYVDVAAELPDEAGHERDLAGSWGLKSYLCVPLRVGGDLVGWLTMSSYDYTIEWSEGQVDRAILFGEIIANALMRKRSIVELRDSEARYRSLVVSAPVGIGMVVNREIVDVNERLCEIVGYTRDEMLGRNARFLYPSQEEYEYVGKVKYGQIKEKGTGTVETRFVKKDGTVIDIILSSTPLDPDDWSKGVTFTALDITERKRYEDELRDREARLNSIFLSAPVGIGQAVDRVITRANDRLAEITGFSIDEMLGESTGIFYVSQEEFDRIGREHYSEIRESGVATTESLFRRKDGRIIDVIVSSSLLDPNDLSKGITFTVWDITARKQAQRDLEASEEPYRQLTDNLKEVFFIVSPDWQQVLYISPAYEDMWGRSCQSLYENPRSWHDAVHEEDRDRLWQDIERRIAGDFIGPDVPEYRVVRPDGSIRWVQSRMFPVRSESGEIYRVAGICEDITERKAAQAALVDSEQRYRTLFENSADGILLMDGPVFVECNPAMCRIWECSAEQIIGAKPWDFSPPLQQDGTPTSQKGEALLEKALTGETQHFQWQHVTCTNRLIECEITLNRLRLRGRYLLQATVRDITQRLRAEREIRESQQRLSNILGSISDGFFAIDRDMVITYYNQAAEDILGVPAEEALGNVIFREVFSEARGSLFEQKYIQALREQKAITFEAYFEPEVFRNWYSVRVYPFEGGISVYFQVTTEQKQAEQRLRDSEERYRSLVENMQEGLWLTDAEQVTTFVNPAMADMLGYAPDEMLGRKVTEFIRQQDHADAREKMALVVSGRGLTTEFGLRHKNGHIVFTLVKIAPFFDAEGHYIGGLAALSDISERRRLEQQRESLMRNLEFKNKELESIIYVASHDLRSPLVNIQGFSAELVRDFEELAEKLRAIDIPAEKRKTIDTAVTAGIPDSLRYITLSAKKMDILLRGLLKVSRLGRETLSFRTVNMNTLLQEVAASLQFRIQQSGAELVIEPDLPACRADRSQLGNVFTNLIDNAVKYLDPERPGRIEVSAEYENSNIVYCVRDNGIGIDPRHQERIFDIFHRLNPSGPVEGEGLGLTIVKRIVDRMDGEIRLESTPGEGSAFYISLPKA